MTRAARVILLIALIRSAGAQTVIPPSEQKAVVVWEPSILVRFKGDTIPKPTVRKEMIGSLLVSGLKISLENTLMDSIEAKLGGEVGGRGDASEALRWLCLHGSDKNGPWAVWLESGEMDGPYIGGFELRRFSSTATFDSRCAALPDTAQALLPVNLRLGSSREEVLGLLGKPTWQKGDVLVYEHQHDETIRGERANSWNIVIIVLRKGFVEATDVTKTTND